jgi:hypothetical protein
MNILNNISPDELVIISVTIAILLTQSLTLNQSNVVGNFFIGLGGDIITISSQEEYLKSQQSAKEQNDYLAEQIDILKKQITTLQNKSNR